ncbi:MAG: BON domain-containing protein [Thermoguttaceae bacterium]|nr:BON domain-containing protein [Thermoguttaceae bacterium]
MKFEKIFRAAVGVAASAFFALSVANVGAQEEVDATASLGVAQQSRFADGAEPVAMERAQIVPGTPLAVNSTMQRLISSSRGSFGGILARYDTENFGKFFGGGSVALRDLTALSDRLSELEDLAAGDNEVDNDVEVARMYPPRLALDFAEFPTRSLTAKTSQTNLAAQIENVVARFSVDKSVESFSYESKDGVVYLRGKLKSTRMIRMLENVVSMQPGVRKVVNEIKPLAPEPTAVDVFGRPLKSANGR